MLLVQSLKTLAEVQEEEQWVWVLLINEDALLAVSFVKVILVIHVDNQNLKIRKIVHQELLTRNHPR